MGRTRREFLESGLAAAALSATVAAAPRLGHAAAPSDVSDTGESVPCAPGVLGEPTVFLGLEPGRQLGDWTILDVRAKHQAVALLVQGPEGEPYQLDVLARETGRDGIAESQHYSVFLVNDGDGSTRSDEQQARGALMVAHYLRWAELHLTSAAPRLATLSQRLNGDPDGSFRIA